MILYDKNKNVIKVYSLEANNKDLYNYRIEQMDTIPMKSQILCAREQICYKINPYEIVSVLEDKDFDKDIIPYEDLIDDYHGVEHSLTRPFIEKGEDKKLLEEYYNELYIDSPVARIKTLKKLRYLLLTKNYYVVDPYDYDGTRIKRMDNIIELTESLFILQMLEQNKFYLLDDYDISKELELFTLSLINEFNIDYLNDNKDKIINKVNNDAKVLKYVK